MSASSGGLTMPRDSGFSDAIDEERAVLVRRFRDRAERFENAEEIRRLHDYRGGLFPCVSANRCGINLSGRRESEFLDFDSEIALRMLRAPGGIRGARSARRARGDVA